MSTTLTKEQAAKLLADLEAAHGPEVFLSLLGAAVAADIEAAEFEADEPADWEWLSTWFEGCTQTEPFATATAGIPIDL